MRVRKLGPDDAPLARAVVDAFHEREVSEAYLAALLADAANMLLVAEIEGEPIGFVWAHWLARIRCDRQQLFVYEIEVAEPHRRQGVGTRLMQTALAEARSKRADVFLLTNRSNPGAVSFYERLGGQVKNGDDLLFVYPHGRAVSTSGR